MVKVGVELLLMRIYMYIRYFFEGWFRGRPDYFAIGKVFAGKKTKAVGIKSFYVLNDRLQFKKFMFNTGSFLLRPEISQNRHKIYLHLRKLYLLIFGRIFNLRISYLLNKRHKQLNKTKQKKRDRPGGE